MTPAQRHKVRVDLRKLARGQPCMVRLNEEWRPVQDFVGLYEVSNFGRVRSISRSVKCRLGLRHVEGRVLRQKRSLGMYWSVQLCDGPRVRSVHVHTLVAEAFASGTGNVVRHLNGDGFDNRAENLAFGSFSDNEADKRRHGRVPLGESHPNHKLHADDVLYIRASGESDACLAKRFGVSRYAIYSARKRLTWERL